MVEDFGLHRRRRVLFGTAVDRYERGRPGYPAEVYALLESVCGLGPDVEVLEIGPGPGQVTGPLLDRGARVTAVELSEPMARRLRERYRPAPLAVLLGAFEAVVLPERSFDVVVAAASFHWVPPELGMAKVAAVLRPGGWAALWWSIYTDSEREDPLAEPLRVALRRHAPHLLAAASAGAHPGQAGRHHGLEVDDRLAAFALVGAFEPAQHHLIRWSGRHTAEEVRLLFGTFSPFLALEPGVLDAVLAELGAYVQAQPGGVVERPYLTAVYLARRLGG